MRKQTLIAALVLTAACGDGDNPRPITGPGAPTLFSVTIDAPQSIAPGTSVQVRMTANYSDGTRTDVTNRTSWSSANSETIQVSNSGVATGSREGESMIAGNFENRSATKQIYVLEPGTWSAWGTVTDGLLPLEGARIEVVSGTGAGKNATSNAVGWFKLFGVAGQVELRVTAAGFDPLTRTLTVTNHQGLSTFGLNSTNVPLMIDGAWMMTIDSAGSCSTLPDVARKRTYTATIEQSGTRLRVTLSGADLYEYQRMFSGRIIDNDVLLKLTTYEYYGPYFDLAERLGPNLDYTVVGTATGRASATSITMTLDAIIGVGPRRQAQIACTSSEHRLSFVRSASVFR